MRLPLALYGVALSVCLVPFLAAQDAARWMQALHRNQRERPVRILKCTTAPREVGHAPPSDTVAVSNRRQRTFSYRTGRRKTLC